MEWLLTGKEPREPSDTILEKVPYINIISWPQYKKRLQNVRYGKTFFLIPIIPDHIAASDALNINEKVIEGFVGIHKTWVKQGHTYCCFRVRYNSMHPIISEGFIVAIDLNENDPLKLEHQIVAARFKDGVVLKYLILTEKDYVLTPYNVTWSWLAASTT